MLRRLRIRFIAVVMAVFMAMLCLVFGLVYHFTRGSMEAQSIRMLQAVAAGPFQPGRSGLPAEEGPPSLFVLRLGRGGELTATGGGYCDLSDEGFLRALIEAAEAQGGQTGVLKGYGLRFCRLATPMGESLAFADLSHEQAALAALVRSCAGIGCLCSAAFLVISSLLARWMVRPAERAWAEQRQFVADASHELKTPLTVIISNAELLQLPDCGEGDRVCFSGRILTMSRQMRVLVGRLLELARADSPEGRAAYAPLNFSELTECAALPFEPLFFEKGLELAVEVQPGIFVEGDSGQLQQIVEILLDNAQKYTRAPGRAALSLRGAGRRRCLLAVSNPCPPMEKEELQNLFKRFYRADRARSRDGSFGLGLSIAKSAATAHRGRIWADWKDGQITFFVELPAAVK